MLVPGLSNLQKVDDLATLVSLLTNFVTFIPNVRLCVLHKGTERAWGGGDLPANVRDRIMYILTRCSKSQTEILKKHLNNICDVPNTSVEKTRVNAIYNHV